MRAHFFGVSVPRSGHHFLIKLLEATFGDTFRHCEFYTADGCCRSQPCTQPGHVAAFFQKHHDFDLTVRRDLPGVVYVVQYRDPVMAFLSDREYLADMEGPDRANDRDEFVVWLGKRAAYYERFFQKWVRAPLPRAVVLEYDELVRDPGQALRRLCTAAGLTVEGTAIDRAIAAAAPVRASFPITPMERPFTRRTLDRSGFADSDAMPVVESLLLDRIPELAPRRKLHAVPFADHPVTFVYRAEDARGRGDLAEATRCIDRALTSQPSNRHLLAERFDLLVLQDRTDEAAVAAEALLALAGGDPAIVRRVSDFHLHLSSTHLHRALALARQLVEARPEDPGHRVHLAAVLMKMNRKGEAQEAANEALSRGARDPYVWRFASEVFAACRNWPPAIDAVRGAIALEPTVPEFHHQLANLLCVSGNIEAGKAAHEHAIALAPQVPGWRWKLSEDLLMARRYAEALDVVRQSLEVFPTDAALLEQAQRLTPLVESAASQR